MIIRTINGGDVELRDMFSGVDVIPLPSQAVGSWSSAGRRITPPVAQGLPPILRGIRFFAETIGSLPLIVYRGDPTTPDKQALVASGTQFDLLTVKPNLLQTPFDFKATTVASMTCYGNAYLLKAKTRRKGVLALYPMSPGRVTPKVAKDGLSITYKVRLTENSAETVEMTRADLIHVPGTLLQDPYIGVSPLLIAANAVGTALATEDYAGRFYNNNATAAGVIEFPMGANTQQAKDTREVWEDRHRGPQNAHRVGALFGGATYKQIGSDALAAQVIDAQKWSLTQAANILGLPVWVLGGKDENPRSTPEQRNMELLQFSIAPQLVRIEQALHADDDLFPDKSLAPAFLADGMLRADTLSRYQAYVQGRQAGWLSANDIRRKENMEPIEGGDEYQTTPVGGAPNLQPGQGAPDNAPVEPDAPVT